LRGRYSEHFAPLQHPREFMKKPHDKQLLLNFRSTQPDVFDAVAECRSPPGGNTELAMLC
jgi:hypothetical protein